MKSQDHVKTNNRPVQINQLINLFPDIDFISLIFCFLKHVCFSLEIPPVKFSCKSRDLWLSHHTLDLVAHKQTYLITKIFLRLKFDKLNTVVKMYSCYVCATDSRLLTDLIFRAKLLLNASLQISSRNTRTILFIWHVYFSKFNPFENAQI